MAYTIGLIAVGAILNQDSKYKVHVSVEKDDDDTLDALMAWVEHLPKEYGVEHIMRDSRGETVVFDMWLRQLPAEVTIVEETFVNYNKVLLLWPNGADFRDYLRGVIDSVGVFKYGDGPILKLCTRMSDVQVNALATRIRANSNVPFDIDGTNLLWTGINALELLTWIYEGTNTATRNQRRYQLYKLYANCSLKPMQDVRCLSLAPENYQRMLRFQYARTDPLAAHPYKARASDAGYDLQLVKRLKVENGVHFYDTCVKVQPPYGYYFEVVGRSSISKTGWMVANNVGVIDAGYLGSIIVALVRSRPDAPEIASVDTEGYLVNAEGKRAPVRLVQMLPRRLVIMRPTEVTEAQLGRSTRADTGGLGSQQFIVKK